MYRLRHLVLVAGAAWICAACVHPGSEVTGQTVGPAPLPPPGAPIGLLRVYTPTRTTEDDQTLYYPHSDFTVLSPREEFVEYVRNADDRWDETPALVRLPPGSYLIRARTRRGDFATVPVVIASGRTTEVYLDGSFREAAAGPGAYATLPDGEVIGWAATPTR